MKRDESAFGKFLVLPLSVALSALSIIFLFSATSASALTPQGKGGTIKPAPTPTPATTKTTTPKKSTTPAKTSRTGASKPPARKAEPGAAKPSAAEIAFWESIKDSKNPEGFRAYLKKYPNGEFAGLARNRLNALEATAKEDAARKEEAKREEAKREEAKRKEEAEKKRPGAVVKNSIGMELVYVPPGSFIMGDGIYPDSAKPVHQVMIREGFYMGKYEVTQAQWQQVMSNNPSKSKSYNLPVENVSWNDTQEFIRKLNAMNDGYVYSLPTEAEWEYACRAGTTEAFAGNLDALAWFYENSGDERLSSAWSADKYRTNNLRTHPVGQKQPNAFGLYDMNGNVWEWCEDWYHVNYNGAPVDGSAWLSGGQQRGRVLRGGSYSDESPTLRSGFRNYSSPDTRDDRNGFRVVALARTQ